MLCYFGDVIDAWKTTSLTAQTANLIASVYAHLQFYSSFGEFASPAHVASVIASAKRLLDILRGTSFAEEKRMCKSRANGIKKRLGLTNPDVAVAIYG